MADASFRRKSKRDRLCDLMNELGPRGSPTLLEPWTTHDLAAHLVLREHDAGAAPGLVVPGAWGPPRRATQEGTHPDGLRRARVDDSIGDRPRRGSFRIGWVRSLANLNEFFVHHEDVRRANGLAPRRNPGALDEALWRKRRLRSVVPRPATARRGRRARVGRDHERRTSTSRNVGGPPHRVARRAVALPLRAPGRGRSRRRRPKGGGPGRRARRGSACDAARAGACAASATSAASRLPGSLRAPRSRGARRAACSAGSSCRCACSRDCFIMRVRRGRARPTRSGSASGVDLGDDTARAR